MRTIAIVGAGDLGGALARQLAASDTVSRVVLIDSTGGVAAGKALDIQQSAAVDRFSTRLDGTTDESAVVGADAAVIADDAGTGKEWTGDQGAGLVGRLAYFNPRALLLCAGAGQLELVERGVQRQGIAGDRLIGSAPEALRAALRSMTALEANCDPAEVSLALVGRPPDRIIVCWDDGSIGGRRAADVLGPPAVSRLEARLPRLWPPAPLSLAGAAATLLHAAATRARATMSAFVAVTRELGEHGRVAMLPVTFARSGVCTIVAPTLSVRDRVRLETALGR